MRLERSVDVAILGAGTAGLSALREVRKMTDNFLLINGGPAGTTCARVGCMPSKVLIQVSHDFHRRHVFAAEGIRGGAGLQVDLPAVMAYVRTLRDYFVGGVVKDLEELGPRYLEGYARFCEPTVLEVNGRLVHAKKTIIATGSAPVIPISWRTLGDRLLTSDTLFEQESLPASIAVVGLGGIGVELGQACAQLGVAVTGFDRREQVAGLTDPEVNTYMRSRLQQDMPLYMGSAAEVQADGDGVQVRSADQTVHADAVLAGLGRSPQLDRLRLDKLGVSCDERGVPSYDPRTLQVQQLPIFIAGDVNGERPLLHEAADDGRIAGYNSVRENPHCFQRRVPLTIVFSTPQAAIVGKSFAEVQEQDHLVGAVSFAAQGRTTIMAQQGGLLRVYGQPQSGQLLGAELAAPDGEHLAHLLAWAIQRQMTVFELLRMPFYHPAVEEGLRTALRNLAMQVHTQPAHFDLALCESSAVSMME